MVMVCKYFQQGRCRFGDQCKFLHNDVAYDDGGTNRRSRSTDQYHYYKPDRPDVNEILQIIQQEIIASEKGQQWPLSCFAPLKEYGNITGWDDISAEELRFQLYISRETGNLDECMRQIQELHHKVKINKNAMMNLTAETRSVIETIFSKSNTSSFSVAPIQNQAPNTFSPGGFGNTASPSIFGGSSAAPMSANVSFGTPLHNQFNVQGSSVGFNTPTHISQNAFNTVASGHSSSIFGGTSTTAQSPTFGGAPSSSTNVFDTPTSALSRNIFGNVPTVTPTNVFGNTTSSVVSPANVFGSDAHTSSIFGARQQPTVPGFGAFEPTVGQSYGFGGTSLPQPSSFQNAGPTSFGNPTNVFDSNQNTNVPGNGTYTSANELPEETLTLFKAAKFVMHSIPTIPPPQELCF